MGHRRQRMAAVDQFDQSAAVDMSVNLRGADVSMAQHGLQRAQVRPALEQMGGKGVAQDVRRHRPRRQAGAGDVPRFDPDRAARHARRDFDRQHRRARHFHGRAGAEAERQRLASLLDKKEP